MARKPSTLMVAKLAQTLVKGRIMYLQAAHASMQHWQAGHLTIMIHIHKCVDVIYDVADLCTQLHDVDHDEHLPSLWSCVQTPAAIP